MQEQLKAIYKEIANKELSFGCKVKLRTNVWPQTCWVWEIEDSETKEISIIQPNTMMFSIERYTTNQIGEIIWHPILIGDILWYIDSNCNWVHNEDWSKSRDMKKHKEMIISVYYYFIWRYNKTIDQQSEECIMYVYNLLKQWK